MKRIKFIELVNNIDLDSNGCKNWPMHIREDGYGGVRIEGVQSMAHRESYATFNGPIGKLWVLHKCDNRACVKPNHLFLGTHKDNMDDMWAKNRGSREGAKGGNRGERAGGSKLKEVEVRAILKRFKSGEQQKDIAKEYKISRGLVSLICSGKRWGHINGDEEE